MPEPLPFIVKLRTMASDDAPSVSSEVRCLAYSPGDACMQAIVQMLGTSGSETDKCKIESVGPDLEGWLQMQAAKAKR